MVNDIKLGRLKIKNRLMLAPMSMYSDLGFSRICYEYGCAYTFTEQIYASDFIKKSLAVSRKIDLFDKGGIQFITNSVVDLKKAIKIVNEKEFYLGLDKVASIDLNLGCPVQSVLKKNLGAAILKNPKLSRELFSTLRSTSDLPVSVKMRLALNAKHKKTKPYLRIAKIAEDEDIDFITVHGRNAGQMYSGDVDFHALEEIKENCDIPVVANGGIDSKESATRMLKVFDAIMIGQHALRAPFIFKEVLDSNWTYDLKKEKINCLKKYWKYAELYGMGFQHIKIHTQSFLKDVAGYEKVIAVLTHTKNELQMQKVLNKAGIKV